MNSSPCDEPLFIKEPMDIGNAQILLSYGSSSSIKFYHNPEIIDTVDNGVKASITKFGVDFLYEIVFPYPVKNLTVLIRAITGNKEIILYQNHNSGLAIRSLMFNTPIPLYIPLFKVHVKYEADHKDEHFRENLFKYVKPIFVYSIIQSGDRSVLQTHTQKIFPVLNLEVMIKLQGSRKIYNQTPITIDFNQIL